MVSRYKSISLLFFLSLTATVLPGQVRDVWLNLSGNNLLLTDATAGLYTLADVQRGVSARILITN